MNFKSQSKISYKIMVPNACILYLLLIQSGQKLRKVSCKTYIAYCFCCHSRDCTCEGKKTIQ